MNQESRRDAIDQLANSFTLAVGWLSLLIGRTDLSEEAHAQAQAALAAVEDASVQIRGFAPVDDRDGCAC
jgi:hypothetical protein